MKNLLLKIFDRQKWKQWNSAIKEILYFAGLSLSTPVLTILFFAMNNQGVKQHIINEFSKGTFFLLTVSFIASALFSVAEVHDKGPIPGKSSFVLLAIILALLSESYVIAKNLGIEFSNITLVIITSIICLIGATVLYLIAIVNKLKPSPATQIRKEECNFSEQYAKHRMEGRVNE